MAISYFCSSIPLIQSSILLLLSLYPSSNSNSNIASSYLPASINRTALLYIELGIITTFNTITKATTMAMIGAIIIASFLFLFFTFSLAILLSSFCRSCSSFSSSRRRASRIRSSSALRFSSSILARHSLAFCDESL